MGRIELKILGIMILITGCAGDFAANEGSVTSSNTTLTRQEATSNSLNAFYTQFHFSNFYTLTDPNANSCAGDLRRYYYPFALYLNKPIAYEDDLYYSNNTIKPSFIKNVSVDLTDANSEAETNLASSCSYGNGTGIPPTSNCASFDFGALGGIPTNLGGSFFMVGGIQNTNYAFETGGPTPGLACGPLLDEATLSGIAGEDNRNVCPSEAYVLGIDSLPTSAARNPASTLVPGLTSASEPISSWSKLQFTSGASKPEGVAGAAVSFNPNKNEILVSGGVSPFNGNGPLFAGADTKDTWIFDVSKQKWTKIPSILISSTAVSNMSDCEGTCPVPILRYTKAPSGRANFGYNAAPGFALDTMSTDGNVGALLDSTDRIIITGGFLGEDGTGTKNYDEAIYKFNPTFGPELIDIQNQPGANEHVVQWMNSSPFSRIVNNVNEDLTYKNNGTNKMVDFGAVTLRQNAGNLVGYILTLGGFNVDADTVTGATSAGNIQMTARTGVETETGTFIGLPTYDFAGNIFATSPNEGSTLYPMDWTNLTEGAAPHQAFDFGGVSVQQGFDLSQNEVVIFGGVNCKDYLKKNGALCPNTATAFSFNSTSRYYTFGTNPVGLADITGTAQTPAGTAPERAGMASARGLDGAGNIIIVAWGGATAILGTATDHNIFYLYDNAGTPTWVNQLSAPVSPRPDPMINGSLVYSHVTNKFYLFGGLKTNSLPTNSNETWELTVTGACTGASTCSFAWRKLTDVSCSPDCTLGPNPSHSGKFVEVNYNNTAPTSEPTCAIGAPCSFGIFYEGGTEDTTELVSALGGRWMFDPTANGGEGHWQRVDSMPARHHAAATSLTLNVTRENKKVNYTVQYGGSTGGPHSPDQITSGKYFIAPTLADTLIYDHDKKTWNRIELIGQGVNAYTAAESDSEFNKRQRYNSAQADSNHRMLAIMSPPPLSGAMMVTRIYGQATQSASTNIEPLNIPEIYLFGGLKKDGSFSDFDNVYKLCLGSTGEDAVNDNGLCDSYNETSNTASQSPVSTIKGRWTKKIPTSGDNIESYLGAAVYDPIRDKILAFGGLTPTGANTFVTQGVEIQGENVSGDDIAVYEYTFPTQSITNSTAFAQGTTPALHGTWTAVTKCSGSSRPTGRYSHLMGFDSNNDQLMIIGGRDASHTPLTQTFYQDGTATSSVIPDIWVAKRNDSGSCYNWRQITVFGNLLNTGAPDMPLTGLSDIAGVYIKNTGYNTGYYTTIDQSCVGSGPIFSSDSQINKAFAGGIYIDIDRSKLGANENLLLTLNYIPLGTTHRKPDQSFYLEDEAALFKVHLVSTQMNESRIREILQPRYITFADTNVYPRIIDTLNIMGSNQTGFPESKQVIIPLSNNSLIDRIHILRQSGSAIITDVTVHRMGNR